MSRSKSTLDVTRGIKHEDLHEVSTATGPLKVTHTRHRKNGGQKSIEKARERANRQDSRRQMRDAALAVNPDDVDVTPHPASRRGPLKKSSSKDMIKS